MNMNFGAVDAAAVDRAVLEDDLILVDRDEAVHPRDQPRKGGRVEAGVDVTALTSNGGRSVVWQRNQRRAWCAAR